MSRSMVNTPSMHHRKHVHTSTQAHKHTKHVRTQACKHISMQTHQEHEHASTQTRKAREHASMQTRRASQACNLADSMAIHGILLSCLGWCSSLLVGIVEYATKRTGLLVLHLLPVLNPWLIVEI